MDKRIAEFVAYMADIKHASKSTTMSYERDLKRLMLFLDEKGILGIKDITSTNLNSYILFLEKEGFSTATVSRNIASMKAFFHFINEMHIRKDDPTKLIKAPHIDRKAPGIMTVQEVEQLLEAPCMETAKGIRDKAMLELLYATGMRVTELISVQTADLNLTLGYLVCRTEGKERIIPFGNAAKEALITYMESVREEFLKGQESPYLFVNCSGSTMSRQGFWKMMKQYADKAGIKADITPRTLRHSFAMHLIQNGADLKDVQEMMGHTDMASMQMYRNMAAEQVKRTYLKAHPRG